MSEENYSIDCDECLRYTQLGTLNKKLGRINSCFSYFISQVGSIISNNSRIDDLMLHRNDWIKSSKEYIEKYEKIECPDAEHTIIVICDENPKRNDFSLTCGIDLLIKHFTSEPTPIKFRLYHCHNSQELHSSFDLSKSQNLWIFGHGDRHGVSFGKGDGSYYPFCKLAKTQKRTFIAQIHCCNGSGKTLREYLSYQPDQPDIFSEGFRFNIPSRIQIEEWIKQDKEKLSERRIVQ
jgi:hypothetical protein